LINGILSTTRPGEALLRSRRRGYRIEEIRPRYNLGILCEWQDRLGPAAAHLQWALAWYRQTGEQPGVADAPHALGVVDAKVGTPELAASRHREAITIFRKLGHPAGEALALNGPGEDLFAAGRTVQASEEHGAALAVATRIEDRHKQARAHVGIARACLAEDNVAAAGRHSAAARDLRTALVSPEAGSEPFRDPTRTDGFV
jgi:hypothetical protein